MPYYTYEVVGSNGELVNGKIRAYSKKAAIEQLRSKQLMVIDLVEVDDKSKNNIFKFKKVSLDELSLFSRQLAAMIDVGIPVTRALFVLGQQANNPALKESINDIARSIEGGMSITEAFKAYPKIFSELYLGMIYAGEIGGTLSKTLLSLSDQIQKEKSLKDSIKSATMYPAAVACLALLLLLGMLLFLVPIFQGFFPEDAILPLPTRALIKVSELLRYYWYVFIVVMFAIFKGIHYYIKSPKGVANWDRIRFRIPVFGPLIQKAVIARFSRTLSTLLAGGIPILQALESSGASSGSYLVMEAVRFATDKIQEGIGIAVTLGESEIFPPMVINMVQVGEETGALPNLLDRIAEFYEDEVATMAKGLTALIEPILLVIVGLVVGGILILLYLPIFTVITQNGM